MGRIAVIIKSWFNNLIGKAERPGLILDTAYEQFVDQLYEVKASVADVATAKHQIQKMVDNAQVEVNKLEQQAQNELEDGNEELALRVLERKANAQIQLETLNAELEELKAQQSALEQNERKLADNIESFGRQKEVKKAQYRSAEAQVKIGESITGINRRGMEVGRAVGRMQEKTEQMEARAKAIPELIKSGTLTDLASGGKSQLDRELDESRVRRDAANELTAMKERLGLTAAKEKPQIEA